MYTYEKKGAEIYRKSFETIRAEADLAQFSPSDEPVAVRMIHASGMVGLERHIKFSPTFSDVARAGAGGRSADPVRCAYGQ